MMRRKSLLVVVLMLVAVLAGGSLSATAASDWVYVEGGPVSPEPVTISVLTHSGHASTLAVPNNELPVYAAIIERLGINIDWQIVESAAYNDTINVRLMSSDLPDMVVPTNRDQIFKLVEDGFFYSYDDLDYETNAPYAQKLFQTEDLKGQDDIYRSIFSDGKMYSFGCTVVPRYLFSNLIINQVWLKNLDMEEPETLDEFYNMLVRFRDDDPNQNGENDEIPFIPCFWEVPNALGTVFGMDMMNPWCIQDNQIVSVYVTDQYKDYLKFRAKLYEEDLVDKENRDRDMTATYELIAQDRLGALAYFGTFQKTLSGYSPYADATVSEPIFREIIPLENVYTGQKMKYARLTTGEGEGMYILKSSKNPEVCLRVADWLWASEEYEILRTFGIEDVSFVKNADGTMTQIQPDDYQGTVSFLTSIGGGQPPFAYRQSELAWRSLQMPWVIERADEIKQYYVDGLPPRVLNAAESAELGKYATDTTTYRDEWTANFISGVASIDDQWDAYVEGYYSIGLAKQTEVYAAKYADLLN